MKAKQINLLPEISKGIYAIAGISKNCGKTSLLNYLLSGLKDKNAGVLTTGRDGEERDEVFGNPKPPVRLAAGTLFTSVSDAIDKLGSSVEVLDRLPFQAGNKKLWLLKALADVETEITGPANVAAQVNIAELMQSKGANIVFIDGSLDRKSIVLHPAVQGVFLVAGSSYGSLEKITAELEKLFILAQIPVTRENAGQLSDYVAYRINHKWHKTELTSLLGNEQDFSGLLAGSDINVLYIPGALTDSLYQNLKPVLRKVGKIIFRHPLNLHLSKSNLDTLLSLNKISCLQSFKIIAAAVNSWSVNGQHLDSSQLRGIVRKHLQSIPVIDIFEG
jgi:hypothetical protein